MFTNICRRKYIGVPPFSPSPPPHTHTLTLKFIFTPLNCTHLIFSEEPGAFSVTCPTISSSQTSLIVAVVVGVTVGVILVAFLVVFIIWYQFFRRGDVSEETSRESAFDFSKKRMETTNPMANSGPHDIKSDDGNDVSNTAKSTSPTSPHPPNGEPPEKTDLSEKSNGKEESNL